MCRAVGLPATRSPKEYCCLVLPVKIAEQAAQINIERGYRTPKLNGEPKKPGKVWVEIDRNPKARRSSALLDEERELLNRYRDKWEILLL
jgi:hypothetical protein